MIAYSDVTGNRHQTSTSYTDDYDGTATTYIYICPRDFYEAEIIFKEDLEKTFNRIQRRLDLDWPEVPKVIPIPKEILLPFIAFYFRKMLFSKSGFIGRVAKRRKG